MLTTMMSLHSRTLAIISCLTLFTVFCILFISIYLYLHRKRQRAVAIANKHLINSSSTSIPANLFVYPLTRVSHPENVSEIALNEIPTNYKTFDYAKRSRHHLSSDSSYASSTNHPSQSQFYSFGTVKSKVQQIHPPSLLNSELITSDSEDIDTDLSTPSFEYSLVELFRLELVYKLYYSIDHNQLTFEIIRLTPMQILIEQCFSSLICKIRLFLNNEKDKTKKYLSKKNPINEIFQFDLDSVNLEKSYLKLHILGQHQDDKRLELGQTVLVIHQYHHLNNPTEEYTKSIQIYEDRIDMIIRQQAKTENEARALICLVYENDRCLLHVGLIKILGIQYLLQQSATHFHHRGLDLVLFFNNQEKNLLRFLDQIQIKISTMIDGKVKEKRKSKPIPLSKGSCTFSTSFHFDYVSLHKTSISITISYRRSLISSQSKPISKLQFGSIQLKNQQTFQHWTDTLSAPNRPHVHWHILESINTNNEN